MRRGSAGLAWIWAAEVYLAVGASKETLRQLLRRGRREVAQQHDVLLSIDCGAAAINDRAAEARRLLQAGYSVCVVSLQRLGPLQRDLPPAVRLIRRPWWWASIASEGSPSYVVTGTTKRERAFTQLFRLRHPRAPILATEELVRLTNEDRFDKELAKHWFE